MKHIPGDTIRASVSMRHLGHELLSSDERFDLTTPRTWTCVQAIGSGFAMYQTPLHSGPISMSFSNLIPHKL